MSWSRIAVPYELKDDFKKKFPRARWVQPYRQWALYCGDYQAARAWIDRRMNPPAKKLRRF